MGTSKLGSCAFAAAIATVGTFLVSPAWAEEAAAPQAQAQPEALDTSLRPEQREGVVETFRDMGVVQRKAMAKSGKFLLSSFFSMDFSDGPYTQYSLNTNPGYAFSDFFEAYASFVPFFVSSARDIVQKIESLELANGFHARIVSPKPKRQYGVEVLWAPLYGKDSLGIRHIIRSDTFLKFGASQIQYESGSGMRFVLGLGKTFFLSKVTGLRFTINAGHVQQIVDEKKSFRTMALVEMGLVFYL